jgi:hypothetical protein
MLLFQYLNALPLIPVELLHTPIVYDESKIGFKDNEYARWATTPELVEWLRENISEHVELAGVQVISSDVPLHCDKRKWALNYLIHLGGESVKTSFHKLPNETVIQTPAMRAWDRNDSEELCTTQLELHRWHLLNTNVLHKVTGVTDKRVAITLGFNTSNPFEHIKRYGGLLSDN